MTMHTWAIIAPTTSQTGAAHVRALQGRHVAVAKDASLLRLLDTPPAAAAALPGSGVGGAWSAVSVRALLGPSLSHYLTFDRVLEQSARQSAADATEELHARSLRAALRRAVDGHAVCLLAHGASSSNKNTSMAGDEHNRGMVGLAMDELLAYVQQRSDSTRSFELVATLLHVRNDAVKDLLYFDGGPLKIVTDDEGTDVVGSRRVRVQSREQIDEIVNIFRTSCSSLVAHTVLSLRVEQLDLRMAADLAARGQHTHLPGCVNLVAKVQLVCLAAAELALAPGHSLGTAPGSAAAASARGQPGLMTLAAQRRGRDPLLVKQADAALQQRRRALMRGSSYAHRSGGAPSASPCGGGGGGGGAPFSPGGELAAGAAVSPAVEQRSIAKSFDALEHVLFQLAQQQSQSPAEGATAIVSRPASAGTATAGAATSPSSHISYRSNKLTWLLCDTLRGPGGGAGSSGQIVLLCFGGAAREELEHSLPVLRFGARVAECFAKRRARDARAAKAVAANTAAAAAVSVPQQPQRFESDFVRDVDEYLRTQHHAGSARPGTKAGYSAEEKYPHRSSTPPAAAISPPSAPSSKSTPRNTSGANAAHVSSSSFASFSPPATPPPAQEYPSPMSTPSPPCAAPSAAHSSLPPGSVLTPSTAPAPVSFSESVEPPRPSSLDAYLERADSRAGSAGSTPRSAVSSRSRGSPAPVSPASATAVTPASSASAPSVPPSIPSSRSSSAAPSPMLLPARSAASCSSAAVVQTPATASRSVRSPSSSSVASAPSGQSRSHSTSPTAASAAAVAPSGSAPLSRPQTSRAASSGVRSTTRAGPRAAPTVPAPAPTTAPSTARGAGSASRSVSATASSARRRSSSRSPPLPQSQKPSSPPCCPLGVPTPRGSEPGPGGLPLPARLLDVLDLLRRARGSGLLPRGALAADPNSARAGHAIDPSVWSWPFHRELVLGELTAQLAQWAAEAQLRPDYRRGASGPPGDIGPRPSAALVITRLEELVTVHGANVPAAALHSLLAELADAAEVEGVCTEQSAPAVAATEESLDAENLHDGRSNLRTVPSGTGSVGARSPPLGASHRGNVRPPLDDSVRTAAAEKQPQPSGDAPAQLRSSCPAGATNDPWLQRQLAGMKAEMRQLHAHLAKQSAAGQPSAEEISAVSSFSDDVDEAGDAHLEPQCDSVWASPAARALPSHCPADTTAVYRDARGHCTRLQLRAVAMPPQLSPPSQGDWSPSASGQTAPLPARAHSRTGAGAALSTPIATAASAAASVSWPSSGGRGSCSVASAPAGLCPSGVSGTGHSAAAALPAKSDSASPRPSLESAFGAALAQQSRLQRTLRQAESMAQRAAECKAAASGHARPIATMDSLDSSWPTAGGAELRQISARTSGHIRA